jgi:predicted 3'-5' exonuclease similar to PolB exonuclease domain
MINQVSAPGLSVRPYFNRYTDDALDLCDILSSFSPHVKSALNELSRMELPGKPDGMTGAEVERCFREGRIREIAEYCETDVGRLNEIESLKARRKPHLHDLIDGKSIVIDVISAMYALRRRRRGNIQSQLHSLDFIEFTFG